MEGEAAASSSSEQRQRPLGEEEGVNTVLVLDPKMVRECLNEVESPQVKTATRVRNPSGEPPATQRLRPQTLHLDTIEAAGGRMSEDEEQWCSAKSSAKSSVETSQPQQPPPPSTTNVIMHDEPRPAQVKNLLLSPRSCQNKSCFRFRW